MFVTPWYFQMLGAFEATRHGERLARFQNRKAGGLAAALAFELGTWLPRDLLAERVWPDLPADNALGCMRVALHSLRGRLEPPGTPAGAVLQGTRTDVRFDPNAVRTDVSDFLMIAHRRDETDGLTRLSKLCEAYRGSLLPGACEDWILRERQRLEDVFVREASACVSCVMAAQQGGTWLDATALCCLACSRAPFSEEMLGIVLRLLTSAGRRREAQERLDAYASAIQTAWGGEPGPALWALASELGLRTAGARPDQATSRRDRPRQRGRAVQSSCTPSVPTRQEPALQRVALAEEHDRGASLPPLPFPLTAFCGRGTEVRLLVARLAPRAESRPECRLITLTGPPGTGKTRLAIETGRELQRRHAARVAFVPLADVRDADGVAAQVERGTGTSPTPGTPMERIVRAAGLSRLVLLLDNLEHVLGIAAGLLRQVLVELPTLSVLATSRTPSEVDGELVVALGPLPVPDQVVTPERLLEFAAVEMFVDRAQRARPDFSLTPGNAPTVRAICHDLDGLPLAIELAAARLSSLTPRQIERELRNRFRFLAARARTSERPHASLEAAIAWSYSLLDQDTRAFLGRLSVFRGGFTLEAARAVWPPTSGGTGETRPDALDHLDMLVRRSLVLADDCSGDRGEMRYRLLESIREFAAMRLRDADRTLSSDLAERHYLHLAEDLAPRLRGAGAGAALSRLVPEMQNLRAAWEVARSGPDGLRLACAVWRLWLAQGGEAEAVTWLREALDNCEAASLLRGPAHVGAMVLSYELGRYEEAQRHGEHARMAAIDAKDPAVLADALSFLGVIEGDGGDLDRAALLIEESVSLRRSLGDAWAVAASVNNLARVQQGRGDDRRARNLFREAYGLFYAAGDLAAAGTALMNAGVAADAAGDYRLARQDYERALELLKRSGAPHDLGIIYYNLGEAMHRDSAHPLAAHYLRESLRIHVERGYPARVPYPLAALGNVAASRGDLCLAVRLHAAASSLRLRYGTPMSPPALRAVHQDIQLLRDRLRPEDFDVYWSLGESYGLEEAVAIALASEAAPPQDDPAATIVPGTSDRRHSHA